MILLIDQGNSTLKWCQAFKGKMGEMQQGDLSLFSEALSTMNSLTSVSISCVKSDEQLKAIYQTLKSCGVTCPINIAKTEINFGSLTNGYTYPNQLGVDRWLAMISCWHQLNSGFIVVDAGSALTLDIVDNTGQHLGGHIVPGLAMQSKLLLEDTDKINFEAQEDTSIYQLGKSTASCVQNGCITNLCSYVESMHLQYDNAYPLFLTGGDADKLSFKLKIKHQVIPDVVLRGLHLATND